jgi:thymidylate synthase (FAD)
MDQLMTASLISYSQPPAESTITLNSESDNEILTNLISFCARVSAPDNQDDYASGQKLINYLVKHQHWSPLEMVSACIGVETTRDIARQFLRHRSFSFQEYSQRYADPTKDLEFVLREARLQDPVNRQNSIECGPDQEFLLKQWERRQQAVIDLAEESYRWAVSKGIAKECARVVLPEGNTISRVYVNGTIRSWVHYVDLRSSNGTQKEHMQIARACSTALMSIFPNIEKYTHD